MRARGWREPARGPSKRRAQRVATTREQSHSPVRGAVAFVAEQHGGSAACSLGRGYVLARSAFVAVGS